MTKETNDQVDIVEEISEEIHEDLGLKNNKNEDTKTQTSINHKKSRKKTLVVVGAGIMIVGGLFFISNNPINQFERALNSQDPSQAVEIYNESIKGNLNYESKFKENALKELEIIKTDYLTQKVTFDEARNLLKTYQKIESVNSNATKIQDFIKTIECSRLAYSNAQEAFAEGDIERTIQKLLKVESIDEENFQKAQEQIDSLKEDYIQSVIEKVDKLLKEKNYEVALSTLTTALEFFPNEETLTSREKEANKLLTQQKKAEEKEKIEKLKAEQKLTVTKAYSSASSIYSHGFAIVKNNTDQVVKNYTIGFLMFDDNGYPVNNTYSNLYGKGNLIKGESDSPNIQPGATFGNNIYWYIEKRASKVKACVIEAEFYDGTTWENPYFEYWYEAEKDRY